MGQIESKIKLPDPKKVDLSETFEKLGISELDDILSDLFESLKKYTIKLADVINGDLRFEENINADIVTVADTGAANTEKAVTHSLKRIPNGFVVISIDKAGYCYDSGTAFTSTTIYIKCSVANAAVKLLII